MENMNPIHQSLNGFLDAKILEVTATIESEVQETENKVKNSKILSGKEPLDKYVRNLRTIVLSCFIRIKTELNLEIIRLMRHTSHIEDLQELRSLEAEAELESAIRNSTEEDLKSAKKSKEYSDYELFLRYSPDSSKKSDLSIQKPDEKQALAAVDNLYQNYIHKKVLLFIFGALVSLACAVADFTIINAVLLSANMNPSSARFSAFIASIVLDVPPYVLGFLITERHDRYRLEEIDGAKTAGTKGYTTAIVIMLIVIILIVMSYVSMRILMFLGGGDFNSALHSVLNGDFKFENSRFNSADVLSIFIPLGTSAVAYAVSFLLSVHYTDFVQKAIITIKDYLNRQMANYQKDIFDSEAKIENIRQNIAAKKESIWATFLGTAYSERSEEFISKIVQAYRAITIPQYIQEYQNCSTQLRVKATETLISINQRLTYYAQNAIDFNQMPISESEEKLLNELWADNESQQGYATINTLSLIQQDVEVFLNLYETDE